MKRVGEIVRQPRQDRAVDCVAVRPEQITGVSRKVRRDPGRSATLERVTDIKDIPRNIGKLIYYGILPAVEASAEDSIVFHDQNRGKTVVLCPRHDIHVAEKISMDPDG